MLKLPKLVGLSFEDRESEGGGYFDLIMFIGLYLRYSKHEYTHFVLFTTRKFKLESIFLHKTFNFLSNLYKTLHVDEHGEICVFW